MTSGDNTGASYEELVEVATRQPSSSFYGKLERSLSMHIIVAFFVCIGLLIVMATLFIDKNNV